MIARNLFFLGTVLISFGFAPPKLKSVPFNSARLTYQGRIQYDSDHAVLVWPGSSVSFTFKGTSAFAVLSDADTADYYNVVVDGRVLDSIHIDTAKHIYFLAQNLPLAKHTLQLFKRTGWYKGQTSFYGFQVPEKTVVYAAPQLPKRKIEFYGNSITCGYATEDYSGHDSRDGYFENNYLSYAAFVARHFNTQYSCIAKSGIGITVSWFPLIMPEMYDRLNPSDSTSKWDFSKYTPDLVVINLFQNDSWIVKLPQNPEFKARFGTTPPSPDFLIHAYKDFVTSIRLKYPKASIICTLGSMDATQKGSPWPGYVQKAVILMHDPNIYVHFFPYKNTPGHPKVAEQAAMAKNLNGFILRMLHW